MQQEQQNLQQEVIQSVQSQVTRQTNSQHSFEQVIGAPQIQGQDPVIINTKNMARIPQHHLPTHMIHTAQNQQQIITNNGQLPAGAVIVGSPNGKQQQIQTQQVLVPSARQTIIYSPVNERKNVEVKKRSLSAEKVKQLGGKFEQQGQVEIVQGTQAIQLIPVTVQQQQLQQVQLQQVQKSASLQRIQVQQQPTVIQQVQPIQVQEKVIQVEKPVVQEKTVYVDRPTIQVQEKVIEKPVYYEKEVEKVVEVEKPVYYEKEIPVYYEKEVEKIVEVPKEVIIEKPVEKIVKEPIYYEREVEKIVEVPIGVDHEEHETLKRTLHSHKSELDYYKNKQPEVVQVEKVVEKPVYFEKEVRVEVPVEKIVEKEVIVERPPQILEKEVIKEVEKPVYYEVEKTIEVPVEKIVEQVVEKPVYVDRIKEIEIPVYIDKIIEKAVYIDRPVETIVEKTIEVEKPVEIVKEVEVEKPIYFETVKEVQIENTQKINELQTIISEQQTQINTHQNDVFEHKKHSSNVSMRIKELEKEVEYWKSQSKKVEIQTVEKPVYVDRVEYVDREKIVEKPVYYEKEVLKEVPVEKIVERTVENKFEIENLQREIIELRSVEQQKQGTIHLLNDEILKLKSRIQFLEANPVQVEKEKIIQVQTSNKQQEAEIMELRRSCSQWEQRVSQMSVLEADNRKLSEIVLSLRKELEQKGLNSNDQRQQQILRNELEFTKTKLDSKNDEVRELKLQLQRDIQNYRNEINQKESQLMNLRVSQTSDPNLQKKYDELMQKYVMVCVELERSKGIVSSQGNGEVQEHVTRSSYHRVNPSVTNYSQNITSQTSTKIVNNNTSSQYQTYKYSQI